MPKYKDSMELDSLTSPDLKVFRNQQRSRPVPKIASFLGALTLILLLYHIFSSSGMTKDVLGDLVGFEEWLQDQESIARRKYLANIGSSGINPDVAAGAVIASPSKEHPDYYYQWVRDAAIVYTKIIKDYIRHGSDDVNTMIRDWARSQDAIQRTENPVRCFVYD